MNNKTIVYFTLMIQSSKELTNKEKAVLIQRLQRKNLFLIGKKLKITGERVRQIEQKALEKFSKKLGQLSLFE
ncbi:MAG TPA: sigma factor-like helix-turn-helix DNA-binding protein [Candidatus Nitrosocosmicus sp.]|nr:sigma factor-like helix-turn-helix DNA-binding protein [Candidatus Nitrosocosmicus sp.]